MRSSRPLADDDENDLARFERQPDPLGKVLSSLDVLPVDEHLVIAEPLPQSVAQVKDPRERIVAPIADEDAEQPASFAEAAALAASLPRAFMQRSLNATRSSTRSRRSTARIGRSDRDDFKNL